MQIIQNYYSGSGKFLFTLDVKVKGHYILFDIMKNLNR